MTRLFRLPAINILTLATGLLLATSSLAAQGPTDLTGKWEFSVVTANGTGTPTVVLKQKGDSLSGTYESARGGLRQLDGTFKAGLVVFTVHPNDASGTAYVFTGTMQSDGSLSGTADFSGLGSASFTGKKQE